jgi:hypothetical protein
MLSSHLLSCFTCRFQDVSLYREVFQVKVQSLNEIYILSYMYFLYDARIFTKHYGFRSKVHVKYEITKFAQQILQKNPNIKCVRSTLCSFAGAYALTNRCIPTLMTYGVLQKNRDM